MRTVILTQSEPLIVEYNDTYFFRHNAEPLADNPDMVEAQEEVIVVPNATYATLVAALVHTRYTADAETAIIANYLADPDNTDHRDEFDAYQSWRAEVKAACKEYFGTE